MGTINKKLKDISPIAVEAEAGNAGRVVYDLKTGVLKLEKELVSLPGSKMPLNLKLYYDVTRLETQLRAILDAKVTDSGVGKRHGQAGRNVYRRENGGQILLRCKSGGA